MKFFTLAAVFLALTLSEVTFAHPEESPVSLEPEISAAQAGTFRYQFQLVNTKTEVLVKDSDLNISHEKILHLVVYDPALREFSHVHPEFDGTLWSVDLNLSRDGVYWIWAQGELKQESVEFSAPNRLTISKGLAAWPTPPVLGDIRRGEDSNSVATLSAGKLVAKKEAMLMVQLLRKDGSAPQITPYLGAFAHVIAVPEDGDSIIHVHPMSGNKPNEGMLHVSFPEAGKYRIWMQFLDANVLKTVPLSVSVVTK